MPVTIYHNPNCSTSRKTLALIRERGIEPIIVEYLKHPLDTHAIRNLIKRMRDSQGASWPGLREGLVRTKEPLYSELGLKDAGDADLIAAMAAHPILFNRPVVVTDKGALLCRPQERVLELL